MYFDFFHKITMVIILSLYPTNKYKITNTTKTTIAMSITDTPKIVTA